MMNAQLDRAERSMRLGELLCACKREDLLDRVSGSEFEICGLSEDSRRIRPGFLFAAFRGAQRDGRDFISDALRRGAAAILTTPDMVIPSMPGVFPGPAWIAVSAPRVLFAKMAAAWFPHRPEGIVAITGTNGKSSTAWFLRQLWSASGLQAAAIGTLGVHSDSRLHEETDIVDAGMTTLAPLEFHHLLEKLALEGVERVALEASSHGLVQNRLDGLCFDIAAFTGFSQDHLDYHGDMESYGRAKLRLFSELLSPRGVAVLNTDMAFYDRARAVVEDGANRVFGVGFQEADLRILSIVASGQTQQVECRYQEKEYRFNLPLIGAFQARNALMAAALAIVDGNDPDRVFPLLSRLENVPGRLQNAGSLPCGATVYVDYAHSPDALANVLDALRPHATGRLFLVFGCGGDRDCTKRAKMGAIAAKKADRIIVTDDNPRTEDAGAIRREILAVCPRAEEIGDRRRAIGHAVRSLERGDVLVIAGKGCERFQLRGLKAIPFSDSSEAQDAIAALREGRQA